MTNGLVRVMQNCLGPPILACANKVVDNVLIAFIFRLRLLRNSELFWLNPLFSQRVGLDTVEKLVRWRDAIGFQFS